MEILGLIVLAMLGGLYLVAFSMRIYSMYIRWGNLNWNYDISSTLMLIGGGGLLYILAKVMLQSLGYAFP